MVVEVEAEVVVVVVIFYEGQTLLSCAPSGHVPSGSGHPQHSARFSARCRGLGCERRSSARRGYQAAEGM